MTRKITSIIIGIVAIYVVFVGVQFFQLQIQRNYNLVNVTTFFSFFFVFLVLLIFLYELLEIERMIRWLFVFVTILNLNYFFVAFYLRMITVAEGTWAGAVHKVNLLFFTREFSVATLIEYNIYFKVPMVFNIIAAIILVVMILIRRKLW